MFKISIGYSVKTLFIPNLATCLANQGSRQYHITPELRKQAEVLGLPVLHYDGVAEVWVHSLQDWLDAVTDKDLAKEIKGELALLSSRRADVLINR